MKWKDMKSHLRCISKAIQTLSLTCGDGAVSGVVVKPVEVFAALCTEIKRTWNIEEEAR